MHFGPSEKVGTGNQEDERASLGNLSLIWFRLCKELYRGCPVNIS